MGIFRCRIRDGDEFVSDEGGWPKSTLPGFFHHFPRALIGSAPLISWWLCGAVMSLEPSSSRQF